MVKKVVRSKEMKTMYMKQKMVPIETMVTSEDLRTLASRKRYVVGNLVKTDIR